MTEGVMVLSGSPDYVCFKNWCTGVFDIVFLPGSSIEISFVVSSASDDARLFHDMVCSGKKHGYSFYIRAFKNKSVNLFSSNNGEAYDLGVLPEQISNFLRVERIWDHIEGADIDAYACGMSKVGIDMSFNKWNDLMSMSDFIEMDCDDMSDDDFQGMMDNIGNKINTETFIVKARIVIRKKDLNHDNQNGNKSLFMRGAD